MQAPPEAIYSSRDDLLTSARNFALSQGYVVTIRRSTANKNVIWEEFIMIEWGPRTEQSAEKHQPVESVALSRYADCITMVVGN